MSLTVWHSRKKWTQWFAQFSYNQELPKKENNVMRILTQKNCLNWASCKSMGEGAEGLIQGRVGKDWKGPRQSGDHKHTLLHPQCVSLLHSPMGRCSGMFPESPWYLA